MHRHKRFHWHIRCSYNWSMNHFMKLLGTWAVLCLVGCSQQKIEEIARSVEVTVQTADAPVAGASVKVIDEQAGANALIALASHADWKGDLPESLSADFFQSLQPASETQALSTDANGKATVTHLRAQHLVVAQNGQNLWLAAASETRDRKLRLGPENLGGSHALELLTARPAVSGTLATAAKQAFDKGQFDQARALAKTSRFKTLAAEIDHAEATALLKQAEQALQEKNHDAAEKLASRATTLDPGRPEAKALLERILAEYGGELRTMTGHTSAVTGVAYSPDGKFVLSGSDDKTLKLWNVADGKEVRTFIGHRGAVTGVTYSPDGGAAASGSADGTVRVWDVATGRQVRTTENLGWKVSAVAFSPRSNLVASAADDNQVTLWRLPNLERAHVFAGHGWRVTSVAFSSNGKLLLSGSEDDSIKLWNAATGQEIRSFQNGLADVTSVAFSPDGRQGVSGGKDKAVKLWNLENGREVQEFKGHSGTIRSVAFARDGRFVLSASDDGTIRLWDLSTGKEFRTFTGNAGAATSMAVSPDGHDVACGSADGAIKVWQLPQVAWPPRDEDQK
jgi:hypothetical protein